jgi:hypothetical protein
METPSGEAKLPVTAATALDEIMSHAVTDLTENARVRFTSRQVESIVHEARRRLIELILRDGLNQGEEVRAAWQHLVTEFHLKRYWGFADTPPEDDSLPPMIDTTEPNAGRAFFRQLVLSMIVIKSLLLYFGGYYASFPGQGYGWGLAAVCAFAVGSMLYLAWRYRDTDI